MLMGKCGTSGTLHCIANNDMHYGKCEYVLNYETVNVGLLIDNGCLLAVV